MEKCAVCGNEYDKLMRISVGNQTEYFDCFECAIHELAPKCANCSLSIIGHGVEVGAETYCSAHCARMQGQVGLADRVSYRSLQDILLGKFRV